MLNHIPPIDVKGHVLERKQAVIMPKFLQSITIPSLLDGIRIQDGIMILLAWTLFGQFCPFRNNSSIKKNKMNYRVIK